MNTTHEKKVLDKKWYIILPAFLTIVTTLVYYPSLFYPFQFDDIHNIQKFFHLRFLENISEWVFKGSRWISYCLNALHYHWDKLEPFVYRRSNLIFHTITGLGVFFVSLTALSGYRKKSFFSLYAAAIAFFTALLFLLHPVQTQTVSYVIQGQLEGLANLFMMLIALCYLFFCKISSWKIKAPLLLLVYVLGLLSCGTKEIAILSPIMLLLLDWFFIAQGQLNELKKRLLFFTTYTLLIASQYVKVLNISFIKDSFLGKSQLVNNIGNVITTNPAQTIKPYFFFISQFKVILHYIFIFFWPFNMSVDYDWVMQQTIFDAECIIPLLGLLIIAGVTLYLLIKDRINLIAFGSLWFFIGLAPRCTFIPSTELLVDYKTYFSSFGILFLIASAIIYACLWIAKKLKQKTPTGSIATSAALCTLLLGYATYDRNKVWSSAQAFWFNIIQNAPKKARAYNNYAVALAEQSRFEEAIPYFRKAIKLDQHYPDPWSNVSVCYSCIGKVDVAIHFLRNALQINPNYPEFYNNLSSYLLQKGEFEEVCKLAQQAIKLRPHYGKAYFNWGQALYNQGHQEEGFEKIKYACLHADYDTASTFTTYAELAVKLEKYEDALLGYTHLAQYEPNNPNVIFNIANAHYYLQHFDEAKKIYLSLIDKNPAEYRCWINLGEIYTKENNLAQALVCYEKAQPAASQYPSIPIKIAECKIRLGLPQQA